MWPTVVAKANHYARLRKRLQQKGTRSATRRLVAISRTRETVEARRQSCRLKRIVEQYPHSLIGLENLTDIRERTKAQGQESEQEATESQHRVYPSGLLPNCTP